jgi:hypothetical protein
MLRPAVRGVVLVCALVSLLALPAVAAVPLPVPYGFVGMDVDGPIYPTTAPGVDLEKQFALMEQAGVQSVRVVFDWSYAQPAASWSGIPASERSQFVTVGGVPTRFTESDAIVKLAAQYGMTVLPTVLYAPGWDVTKHDGNTFGRPVRNGPYAAFLTALVDRYGPKGTLWSEGYGPKTPIREWQIWNEPNIGVFWPTQPFAKTYVALLRAAHAAIKKADPGAKTVIAGFPNFSWLDLKHVYDAGGRSAFDVVAVHPYTAKVAGVIQILQNVRAVMNRYGDRAKPMIADEVSWTSSKGHTGHNVKLDIATTEKGQASNIAALLPLLARDRRSLGLSAFYYYTWAGAEVKNAITFAYAGLLKYDNGTLSIKPAFTAFERAALKLERCRRKGPLATQCAQRG